MEIQKQYVNQQLLNGDIMEYNYNMEYMYIISHRNHGIEEGFF